MARKIVHGPRTPAHVRKLRGFTLIELIIVMLIAAVVSTGAIVMWSRVDGDRMARDGIHAVTAVVEAVHAIYPVPPYSGLTTAVVNDSGRLPSSWMFASSSSTELRMPWGGGLTVTSLSVSNRIEGAISIEMLRVPRRSCVSLLRGVEHLAWHVAAVPGSSWVVYKNQEGTDNELTAADISAACSAEPARLAIRVN